MGRQGHLDQDAVDLIPAVELLYALDEFPFGGIRGQDHVLVGHPHPLARLLLQTHIELGGRVVPHQDGDKPWGHAPAYQLLDALFHLLLDLSGKAPAVDYRCQFQSNSL